MSIKSFILGKMVLDGSLIHLQKDGDFVVYTKIGNEGKRKFTLLSSKDENFVTQIEERILSLEKEIHRKGTPLEEL